MSAGQQAPEHRPLEGTMTTHHPLVRAIENSPGWEYRTVAELYPDTPLLDPRDGEYVTTDDPLYDDAGNLRVIDLHGDLRIWEEPTDQIFLAYLG